MVRWFPADSVVRLMVTVTSFWESPYLLSLSASGHNGNLPGNSWYLFARSRWRMATLRTVALQMCRSTCKCFRWGGGVMTGNCAMEELLFLKMQKWMVAVALQNRTSDTEVISVTVARQYSRINGCGSEFEFGGEHQTYLGDHRLPRAVAMIRILPSLLAKCCICSDQFDY